MRASNVRLLRGAALAAALVAGLLLGRRSHDHSEVREETVATAKTGDSAVERSRSPKSGLFAKLDSLESRTDYETLLKELQTLPLAERDFAIEMLFLRWARTDPEGAIAAAEREHDPNLWLKSIYRGWGARDLMAALESLGARKKDHDVSSIAWHMRDHVTSENVDEVFEFMRDRGWKAIWDAVWREMDNLDKAKERFLTLSHEVYYGAVPGLASRLAEQDVDAALEWASKLNRGSRSAVGAIVKVVEGNGDFKKAYEILKDHGGVTVSPETIIAVAKGSGVEAAHLRSELGSYSAISMARAFFDRDPKEAIAFLNTIPKENVRQSVRQFADLLPRYSNELAQWLQSVDDVNEQSMLTEQLAEHVFGRLSGKRLEMLAEELPQGPLKSAFQSFVDAKRELLEGSGEALAEWFESTSEDTHWYAIRSLYAEVKEQRPELLGELVGVASQSARAGWIASSWQTDFPEEAGSWLSNQVAADTAGERRQVEGIVAGWASTDLDAAVSWFRESAPEWMKTPELNGKIAAAWAQRNTSEVVAWASALPDRDQRLGALAGVADSWGDYDLPGVTEWAASLEDAGERDRVAKAFLPLLFNADPRSAAVWALSLSEVSDRAEHLQLLIERQSHRKEEILGILRETEMEAAERDAIVGGLEEQP